ncbi:AraC family transcriptional regulator [Halomonas nitroreducens]|uniref:AraC family transcriptional regulator n=2 Tax=Halomonas nitroreducens TaxID=447425 RepID=A0A3S0JXC4_9GAMM|nr:AraC family transcriptional regulator [Halomonas nitroreducens]
MKGNFVLNRIRTGGPAMQAVPLLRDRYALPVLPSGVGYDRVADERYRWHGLERGDTPFAIVQHTLAGEGWLRFEGRRLRLGPGDCMLVTVPHDHSYWWQADGAPWEFLFMSLHGHEALRLQRLLIGERGPVVRPRPVALEILAAGVARLLAPPLPDAGEASSLAYRLLMTLHDAAPSATDRPTAPPTGVARALEHLQAALHADPPDAARLAELDVSALARLAGLSRAHFTRRFVRAVGQAPGEYLLQERMRRAAELLARREVSVKAVALSLGFHDPNYFAKAFRRSFGVSPREFRSSGMYFDARRQPADTGSRHPLLNRE